MGVPEHSDEWESPKLDTGPLTSRLGYSWKKLGLEVPVVIVLCFDLPYLQFVPPEMVGPPRSRMMAGLTLWRERLAASNSPVFCAAPKRLAMDSAGWLIVGLNED
jgi:hypothetical protein